MNCIQCGTNFDASSGRCPSCQWNPNARQKPLAGYLVGETVNERFIIKESIGMGRLGVVVKAMDLKTNKPVALKCIHPALIPDDETGNRFLAAMRVHKETESSGLAKIIDVAKDAKNYYVARELYYGVTFKQLLEDQQICGQPFPIEEGVEIIQQISRILNTARGAAHGTFSPSKVWIMDQRVQIVDFGLAAALPPDAVWHCMRRHGNRFIAPEFVDNRPADATGDVYALGVMLGEMLSLAEFQGQVDIFRESEPDFPVEIEALLRCALSRDVDVRYADAREFVAALYDVTGFQRTNTMPPDNTHVVPSKFLNTLRTMSEVPPPPAPDQQASDADTDAPKGASPFDAELFDDTVEDDEPEKIITRQVALDQLMEEAARDEDDLSFLDDIEPEFLDDDDDDDLDDDLLLSSDTPAPISGAVTPPPSRPSNVNDLAVPTPSAPPPPMRGKVDKPLDMPQMMPPKPSIPPPVPGKKRSSVPVPAAGAGSGKRVPPPSASRPPTPTASEVPMPAPSVPAPPRSAPPSPSSDAVPDAEASGRFEGINPRFLRAAAKLEKTRISGPEETDEPPTKEEEDWRKQLEESTAGSVISFLPPATVDNPADVRGFPNNQKSMRESPLPMSPRTAGKSKTPPPVPKRRK